MLAKGSVNLLGAEPDANRDNDDHSVLMSHFCYSTGDKIQRPTGHLCFNPNRLCYNAQRKVNKKTYSLSKKLHFSYILCYHQDRDHDVFSWAELYGT